jgi:two-component sensor histidine kinase
MPDNVNFLTEDKTAFARFSSAQVATGVTNPGPEDSPVVDVNEAFQRMTGYDRTATSGRDFRFLRGIQKKIRRSATTIDADRVNSQLIEIQGRAQKDLSGIILMIRRQSRQTTKPEDFFELSPRVEALQLLYDEMKLSDVQSDEDQIELDAYLTRLASSIAHTNGRPGICMSLHVAPLDVPIETATRVGLALSEALTNAFKHAFHRMDTGLIEELEGKLMFSRDAAGSVITIDVPAGATETDL